MCSAKKIIFGKPNLTVTRIHMKKNYWLNTFALFIALIFASCSNDDSKKIEASKEQKKDTTTVAETTTPEEEDPLANIPSMCKPFFTEGNKLTFVEERVETTNCFMDEATGEMIDGEPKEKTTRKTIKVEVVKVEKNKKGVWVATLKHNGNFANKWYTDESAIWTDEMAIHFQSDPKPTDRQINEVSVSVYYDKRSASWAYTEQVGDGMYIINFSKTKGVSGFSTSYSNMCETIDVYTRLK